MAEILKGKAAADKIKEEIKELIAREHLTPHLAVVRVGEKGSDLAYERGVLKTCDGLGIKVSVYSFAEDISQEELENEYIRINADPQIHGILLFKPLPKHLDEDRMAGLTDPEKDMDCITLQNQAKLYAGDRSGYFPCTAEAVTEILKTYDISMDGANVTVIGRSNVIGKPLGLMLLSENATVTWCHTHTKDMAERCTNADIIVGACGVAELIGKDMVSRAQEGCTCIDVGMNFKDGKMCGDFNFDEVFDICGAITPVPGGVGSVTNTILALHVTRAAASATKTY